MARTLRDSRLETRTARARLAVRGKPYWRALDPHLHLGYRRGKTGGKWLVRWYAGAGRYQEAGLSTADDNADADGVTIFNYSQAQVQARQRATAFAQAAQGKPLDPERYSVADCLADYLAWMRLERKSWRDAQCRAKALILPQLGTVPVRKLTYEQIRDWFVTLARTPPRVRTTHGHAQNYRDTRADPEADRKRKATANRVLTTLKAALNRAWQAGYSQSDSAWRRVKPFHNVDAARLRYLTVDEAQRLLNASGPALRELLAAALATGARYSELARLVVGDFNPTVGTLHIRQAKSGHSRHVILTEEGTALFSRLTLGRLNHERILSPGADLPWTHNRHQRPLREACQHARIDPPISFHILRHSYASLAVMAGMPLLVLAQNLGHQNTRMLEKHYGHLAPSYVADAIRATAPRFGFGSPGGAPHNVAALPLVKPR